MRNKVSEIEFHITFEEVEDCILRAAELIKEGYMLYSYRRDDSESSFFTNKIEPCIHVVFRKGYYE